MEDIFKKGIDAVETLLADDNYQQALDILKDLSEQYPNNGIISYYLGRLSIIGKDDELAVQYFLKAEEMGYKDVGMYLSVAMFFNEAGAVREAEKYFMKADKIAYGDEYKWAALSAMAVFYIENSMYLKAERIIKDILKLFPENYQGYHLHILVEILKEHYDEALAYIRRVPDKFQKHPQLLLDYIEIYKQQGREDLDKLFEEDARFMSIIPQEVLKERMRSLPDDEESINEKEKIIVELAKKYQDSDAIVSLMILNFAKSDFERSSKIANIILENEKSNQGLKYYLALYFQIYNLYCLSDKKPSEELRRWVQDAGNWCVNFAESLQLPEVGDTVRNSMKELFEEINMA